MRFLFAAALSTLAPLVLAATEPVRLQPASKWVVDYADESCRLVRQFGEGPNTSTLAFESPAPDRFDMLVIGRPFESSRDGVPARFLPAQGKPILGETAKSTGAGLPGVLWRMVYLLPDEVIEAIEARQKRYYRGAGVRPPAIDLAEEARFRAQRKAFSARATRIEIVPRSGRPVILETGSLGPAMAALEKCSRDSLSDWGIDPSIDDRIVRPPWGTNRSKWFSANDYPPAMLRALKQSEVNVRLLVDASGRVTKCTSLSHFDVPEFERIVCDRLTKRATFEPAELADGTKVPSYYVTQIIFRIAG